MVKYCGKLCIFSYCVYVHYSGYFLYRCNLPLTLEFYGLSLPDEIVQHIKCHVLYPPETEGMYEQQPGQKLQNISIKLQASTTLNRLNVLCESLERFFAKFEKDSLKVLVFFHVHKSSLFSKWLSYNIQCHPVTVEAVSEAIQETKALIVRLIQGEAEYREIVAKGTVVLKDIDTKLEISILEKSISVLSLQVEKKGGLPGVKSMIELFKASSHINTLRKLFQRYNLTICVNDADFKELCEIALCANDQLTPNLAIQCLNDVRTKLKIPDEESVDCLEILDVVLKSKTFYDFLLVRRFYGERGHKSFRQQYELITAQLLNKASDFEEKLLNDLLPAFKFLSPFIAKYDDSTQRTQPSFNDLVSEMWKLDTKHGPKQLQNVYENVHLVLQWFSEVQVYKYISIILYIYIIIGIQLSEW